MTQQLLRRNAVYAHSVASNTEKNTSKEKTIQNFFLLVFYGYICFFIIEFSLCKLSPYYST